MDNSEKLKSSRINNILLRAILAPLETLLFHKVELFLWFSFVIVAGLLGVIINIIKRWIFDGWDFSVALGPDSAAGSFYTFSLVMISSLIYPLFSRFIKSEKPEYRKVHILYITILIFTLLFCGVFYSFSTLTQPMGAYTKLQNVDMRLDRSQLLFFVLSIVFSVYSFGLTLIGQHEEELHLSDDYLENEQHQVKTLSKQSSSSISSATTPNGTKITI